MKIIIYGVGNMFQKLFLDSDFGKRVYEKGIEVVGLTDSNKDLYGQEIFINGKSLTVCDVNKFIDVEFDQMVVSSKQFYDEIKRHLLNLGFPENKIVLVDIILHDYYKEIFGVNWLTGKKGVEIGGPSNIFSEIYEVAGSCDGVNFSDKTIWWKNEEEVYSYQKKALGKVIIDDATQLRKLENDKYDFLLSSNNLEHIANPMKALSEFRRVLKEDGLIIIVVPRKDKTFDHNREYTTFQHILEDYENDIDETDLSHLPEIIEKHDYDMDLPCGGKENFIIRSHKNYENRCLHHHVFSQECLAEMFRYLNLEIVNQIRDADDWIIIGKKH
ncbi:MAG: class I SAM-dependent methyltransferase [Butyrivibrio sp.]|nr:class I SAM-dependent methyltransferase [Butyrivibrio sp.]